MEIGKPRKEKSKETNKQNTNMQEIPVSRYIHNLTTNTKEKSQLSSFKNNKNSRGFQHKTAMIFFFQKVLKFSINLMTAFKKKAGMAGEKVIRDLLHIFQKQ